MYDGMVDEWNKLSSSDVEDLFGFGEYMYNSYLILFPRETPSTLTDYYFHCSAGAMDAGSIQKDILIIAYRVDPRNAISRGLRLGRNNGDLFAQNMIHQRGFSNVWTPHDSNKACSFHSFLTFTSSDEPLKML